MTGRGRIFYNICAKVTHDTDSDSETDQFGCYGYTWQDALIANGIALFTEGGSSCLISAEAVQAVAFAQRLDKLTAETAPSARDFDEGKGGVPAVPVLGLPDISAVSVAHQALLSFLWDCIPMPHGPAGGNSSELSTVLAGISSRDSEYYARVAVFCAS